MSCRYFCKMVEIFSSRPFYITYVKPPSVDNLSPKIHSNKKFWPYFKDTISTIDSSHLLIAPPLIWLPPTEITKAFFHKIAFSCMTSISTSDAWIFGDACLHNLDIPNSKYQLGDLRFPSKPSILVPYQGVWYHLTEWGRTDVQWVISPFSLPMLMKYRPVNHQELFNLRHASAWNVIECAFGVLKKCSQILLLPLPYLLNI